MEGKRVSFFNVHMVLFRCKTKTKAKLLGKSKGKSSHTNRGKRGSGDATGARTV